MQLLQSKYDNSHNTQQICAELQTKEPFVRELGSRYERRQDAPYCLATESLPLGLPYRQCLTRFERSVREGKGTRKQENGHKNGVDGDESEVCEQLVYKSSSCE